VSWSDVRTATKLKLEGVTGVENVFDYVVWTDNWQYIYDNFSKSGRINAWFIGLANANENTMDKGLKYYPYLINLFAYYAIKTSNESSKAFETIVMAVRDEFMKSFDYIKTFVPTFSNQAISKPPVTIAFDHSMYVQVPCHRCQIQIPVTETKAEDLQCKG
jgi:hypothetical protein